MSIHEVDENTVVLYPLTTISVADSQTTTLANVTGSFSDKLSWSEVDTNTRTKTIQIPDSNKIVQFIDNNSASTARGGSSLAAVSATHGSYTIMGWIYRVTSSEAISIIRLNGGDGIAEIVNCTLNFSIDASDHLQVFQEYEAGQNGEAIDTSGSINTKEWTHVAVTKEVSGLNASFNFYINGVATSTNLVRRNCTGGINPMTRIMQVGDFSNNQGALHSIQWDTIVRSPTEISAAASSYEPAWDENTFAAWSFEQLPFSEDLGRNKLHLCRRSGVSGTVTTGSILNHNGVGIIGGNISSIESSWVDDHSLYQTMTGNFTVEMLYSAVENNPTDIIWGFGGNGEDENQNMSSFDWINPRTLHYLGEKNSGTDINVNFNNSVESGFICPVNYWAFVRELKGKSANFTIYKNGKWFESRTVDQNTSGYGPHWISPLGRSISTTTGWISDFKLSNVALPASHFENIAGKYQTSGSNKTVLYGGLVNGTTVYNENSPPDRSTFSWIVNPNHNP